ncbi:MAG: hypothetical protein HYZ81_22495 [Nitrospinae bacterium]|nr:hypothetical protein [Nitrospinota bacterium]
MGYADAFDILTMVLAVKFVLQRLGYLLGGGAGVRAVEAVLVQPLD